MDIAIRFVSYRDIKNSLKGMVKEHVALREDNISQYLGAFVGEELVGCVGFAMYGKKMRYKTDFVRKDYRCKGIYHLLWETRDKVTDKIGVYDKTAFCTSMSIGMYEAHGFKPIRVRKGITFVEKRI